jgi:hypothetical protein
MAPGTRFDLAARSAAILAFATEEALHCRTGDDLVRANRAIALFTVTLDAAASNALNAAASARAVAEDEALVSTIRDAGIVLGVGKA